MRNPFAVGKNRQDDRFIRLARQNKKIEVFEMLRAGQDINARDGWGVTALCAALDHRNDGLAVDLLAAGADPNIPGRGRTPLECAVLDCKIVIPALIDAGARPVIRDPGKGPASLIFWAITYRNWRVLDALIKGKHHLSLLAGEKVTPFEAAVTAGADDMAMALLDAGARPEGIDLVTAKPLVFSLIREERLELVGKMVEKGADMTVRDPEGKSADDLFRHVLEARRLAGEAKKREQEEQDRQREERIAAAALQSEEQEKERRKKEAEKTKKNAWTKTSDDDVLHARFHPGLGRELRDIFNFRTRERMTAVVDPKTGRTEALAITHFQHIDSGVLEEALDAFRQQGGAADRSVLRGPALQRDKRPLLGGGG